MPSTPLYDANKNIPASFPNTPSNVVIDAINTIEKKFPKDNSDSSSKDNSRRSSKDSLEPILQPSPLDIEAQTGNSDKKAKPC